LAELRSVEFVGDELSVPGQQRIWLRDSRQFFKGFPSEPLGDLSYNSVAFSPSASSRQPLI
jgi:hypothetical protein